tara:strand:+ start:1036 stop:1170 length:135 start_codon:yes stop_codon:yes gene_type:complete
MLSIAITEAIPIMIASAVKKDLVAFDFIESRAVLIDSENNKLTP